MELGNIEDQGPQSARFHNVRKTILDHFSICACHPCAGAMLIFSVLFQVYQMSPKTRRCEGDIGTRRGAGRLVRGDGGVVGDQIHDLGGERHRNKALSARPITLHNVAVESGSDRRQERKRAEKKARSHAIYGAHHTMFYIVFADVHTPHPCGSGPTKEQVCIHALNPENHHQVT